MLHASAPAAFAMTVALAVLARLLRAVNTSGALAGVALGGALAATHGLAGMAPLGAFFVLGSVATRVGWRRKTAAGTAERGGGARGAARVLAKGGVAAIASFLPAPLGGVAVAGALAAALGDTLGTELGALARGRPRMLPSLRAVTAGTPGAVSVQGTLAVVVGAALVGAAASGAGLISWPAAVAVTAGGAAGAMLESLLVGVSPAFARAPGTWRNVLTTAGGAVLAAVAAAVAGVTQ